MLITQLHLCLLAVAAWRRCQPQAAPPHTLRSNPHYLPLPPLSPLSNYKFRTQMRLINKYETSMRARGWEHYRSTVGARELANNWSGNQEPAKELNSTWLYSPWHGACRKDYARNQYSSGPQRKGSATFPERRAYSSDCVWREEWSAPVEAGLSLNLNKLHTFDFGFRANAFLGVTFALL